MQDYNEVRNRLLYAHPACAAISEDFDLNEAANYSTRLHEAMGEAEFRESFTTTLHWLRQQTRQSVPSEPGTKEIDLPVESGFDLIRDIVRVLVDNSNSKPVLLGLQNMTYVISVNRDNVSDILHALDAVVSAPNNPVGSSICFFLALLQIRVLEVIIPAARSHAPAAVGAYFPYLLAFPEAFPSLDRYGIYNGPEVCARNYETTCIIRAITESLRLQGEEPPASAMNRVRMLVRDAVFPKRSLPLVVDALQRDLCLHFFDRRGVRKKTKYICKEDTAKPAIDIALYDGHYFVLDKSPFTTFALKNARTIVLEAMMRNETSQFTTSTAEACGDVALVDKSWCTVYRQTKNQYGLGNDTRRTDSLSMVRLLYQSLAECPLMVKIRVQNGSLLSQYQKPILDGPLTVNEEELTPCSAESLRYYPGVIDTSVWSPKRKRLEDKISRHLLTRRHGCTTRKEAAAVIEKDKRTYRARHKRKAENGGAEEGFTSTNHVWFADLECTWLDKTLREPICTHASIQSENGKVVKNFMGDDCMKRMLFTLRPEGVNTVYFHNANFDIRLLLTVPGLKITADPVIRGSTSIIRVQALYQSRKVVLKCSYAHMAAPLASLPASFDIPYSKEPCPYNVMDRRDVYENKGLMQEETVLPLIKQELSEKEYARFLQNCDALYVRDTSNGTIDLWAYNRHYCEMDVTCLRECFLAFRKEMVTLLGSDKYDPIHFCTITSLGHRYLEDNGVYDGLFKLSGCARVFIAQSVVGGRCTSAGLQKFNLDFRTQEAKEILDGKSDLSKTVFDKDPVVPEGGVSDLDGNSMYPSATVRVGYPKGTPKVLKPEQRTMDFLNTVDAYWVEIKVDSVAKETSIPVMSYVTRQRSQTKRVYTNDMVSRVVVINDIDLNHWVKRHGITFTILRGLYFDSGLNTEVHAIVHEWYNRRLAAKQAGHKAVSTCLKLLLNSALFGRSIMRVQEKSFVFLNSKEEFLEKLYLWHNSMSSAGKISDSLFWIRRKVETGSFTNLAQVGSRILSESKLLMDSALEIMDDIGAPAFFTDTDSVHLLSKDVRKVKEAYEAKWKRPFLGKQLGEFSSDLEAVCPRGWTKCGEPVSALTIYCGKKIYMDLVVQSGIPPGKEEVEENRKWVADYHLRCKGVPSSTLEHTAKLFFGGDVIRMYQRLYLGKPTTFDLTNSGSRFCAKVNAESLAIISMKTMNRQLRCVVPKEAWNVMELEYNTPVLHAGKRKRAHELLT